ncbi:filamentous hemagglutinin N-terminal domain-containing protein [Klebsiella aerogenes]|uniref:filamentous hemagglutinin N-terminal domain-containing protein n=1 Tax=Klebsiella aerogenes TaxID=548 RepID=UPI00063C9CC6|nr:filamentous hemagglutinin N-terminal domain-containing protein [Klebsiella aerogenes]KLF60902.1 filamentous hemagglutinin [Klebsiella aerogenes]
MFKFKLTYVALAAALSSTVVYADPTTYTHLSGAKVVDIEAPNAAGVSHNLYREFNVDGNGLILNNSSSDIDHTTFGNIAKNNNLTNGGASVILNEVTSNKASSLNGFIEVAGLKADVVIANPNGITCSGCSFVNTNKAVLTTGQVNLTDEGAIGSYTITKGKVTIGEKGMDASTSYAALLADAVAINGMVNAGSSVVGGGNFTFDNSTGVMTSAGKTATMLQMLNPVYSIDISSLGGIKANSISMVGNNLGFGVRNKGSITANSSLSMTNNGLLTNDGSITSNGLLTSIAASGNFTNNGTLTTKNLTKITTYGAFTNGSKGTISSTKQLVLSAVGNLQNSGTISATSNLIAASNGAITNNAGAKMTSNAQITATSLGNLTNAGTINGKNVALNFVGTNFKNTGTISATSNVAVKSLNLDNTTNTGEIYNLGSISGENIDMQTNGTLAQSTDGKMTATDAFTAHSYWLNNNGAIKASTITTDHSPVNNTGSIKGDNVSITSRLDIVNEGTIFSTGDMLLSTQNKANINNYGVIQANGTLTLTAKKIVNSGRGCGWLKWSTCDIGTIRTNKLILNSSHNYANEMGGYQYFKIAEINTVL